MFFRIEDVLHIDETLLFFYLLSYPSSDVLMFSPLPPMWLIRNIMGSMGYFGRKSPLVSGQYWNCTRPAASCNFKFCPSTKGRFSPNRPTPHEITITNGIKMTLKLFGPFGYTALKIGISGPRLRVGPLVQFCGLYNQRPSKYHFTPLLSKLF